MEIENTFTYAICTIPRSGSSLMCKIVSELGIGYVTEHLHERFQTKINLQIPMEEIILAVMKKGESSNGIKGIKIMNGNLQNLAFRVNNKQKTTYTPDYILALCQIDKYIFLRRKNNLRQAISSYKASISNVWSIGPEDKVAVESVKYNRFQIQKTLYNIPQAELEWTLFFERNQIKPLEIYYEDFIANYQETLTQICVFLGVKLPPNFQFPAPPLKKQANEESENFYNRFQNPNTYEKISSTILMALYRILKPIYRFLKNKFNMSLSNLF